MNWLVDWLMVWLIGWLVGWLIAFSIDWLTDRLMGWLIDGLIDWTVDWLIDWLNWYVDKLIDWLVGWMIWLLYRSFACLIDWMFAWSFDRPIDVCLCSLFIARPLSAKSKTGWKHFRPTRWRRSRVEARLLTSRSSRQSNKPCRRSRYDSGGRGGVTQWLCGRGWGKNGHYYPRETLKTTRVS